jgi:23S rRNA pseudouridine1911/1915/1917 synthase
LSSNSSRINHWTSPPGAASTPLDRFVRDSLGSVSWNQARRLIATGKVTINGEVATQPTVLVAAGDEVCLEPARASIQRTRPANCTFVYLDSQVVVVDKPAGISTVPFDDTERDSLLHRVRASLGTRQYSSRLQVLVVHRIDKETSGLVVFARTNLAFKHLKQLFRVHAVERRYVALVHGRATDRTIRSRLVADRGDGRRGSTTNNCLGRDAITHIHVLEHFESATLIECQLETGRTHQIRIHLSEIGHPLLGERVYMMRAAEQVAIPRLMLHARDLGFQHPTTGEVRRWSLPPPADMTAVVDALRAQRQLPTPRDP